MGNEITTDHFSANTTNLKPALLTTLGNAINIEKDPKNIKFAKSIFGRCVLFFIVLIILDSSPSAFNTTSVPTVLGIALCAYSGRYRYWCLFFATFACAIYYGVIRHGSFWIIDESIAYVATREGVLDTISLPILRFKAFCLVVLFSIVTIQCTGRYKKIFPFRRPLFSLFVFFFVLVILFDSGALQGKSQVFLWAFIQTLSAAFCFLGYALLDQHSKTPSKLPFQLGTFYPFWGSSWVPFGKGAAYLRKMEVKDADGLAILQLKAIKLMAWSLFLKWVYNIVWMPLVTDRLGIPELYSKAFPALISGSPYPWYLCWESLIVELLGLILSVTAETGIVVACVWMSGFNIAKHCQNPLASKSIAEFWNRYSFYMKELFVDFFFFPTFLRFFHKHPKLRVFFATFIAVGFGNILIHFIAYIHIVVYFGLLGGIQRYLSHIVYGCVLAFGIALSQLSSHKPNPSSRWWQPRRITTTLSIILFYCFLRAIEDPVGLFSSQNHYDFVMNLFGLN